MERPESLDYAALFEQAWRAEGSTSIELSSVDVNAVLDVRYSVTPEARFTGTSLWDMEVRKASAPDIYLGGLVKPGSVERFPSNFECDSEYFTRVSDQQLWLDEARFGTVIEHVQLDHDNRRAFFLGAASLRTPDGRRIDAGTAQPLFHVEHSVAGSEESPLNIWRIVLITGKFDNRLAALFTTMGKSPYLRDFIEVYLRREMHREVRRLPV